MMLANTAANCCGSARMYCRGAATAAPSSAAARQFTLSVRELLYSA